MKIKLFNLRTTSVIMLVISVVIILAKGYHYINRKIVNDNLQKSRIDFFNENTKLAFIENVYKRGLFEPPFGDIFVIDLESREEVRLNYDSYYDRYPSLSKTKQCIYFESKRGESAKTLHLGSPSDIYKFDLKSNEIVSARKDIEFALIDTTSSIEKPIVSSFNDSIIVFTENGAKQDYLVLCNYIQNEIIFQIKNDSVLNYWFGDGYILIRRKLNMYSSDKAKYYYYDFRTSTFKNCGHILSGNVVGLSKDGNSLFEIKKVNDESFVRKIDLRNEVKEKVYIKDSNRWEQEGDFSSVKLFLEDTTAIVEKYTDKNDELANVFLIKKNNEFERLTSKPRKRIDFTIWH
jgi:hypothetical protein